MKKVNSFSEAGEILKPQLEADAEGRHIVRDCIQGRIKSLREVEARTVNSPLVKKTNHLAFVKAMFMMQTLGGAKHG